jgi:hypothetical protein
LDLLSEIPVRRALHPPKAFATRRRHCRNYGQPEPENVEGTYHISATKESDGYQLQLTPRNPSMKRFLQMFTIKTITSCRPFTDMVQPNGDRIVTTYSNESRGAIPPRLSNLPRPPGRM